MTSQLSHLTQASLALGLVQAGGAQCLLCQALVAENGIGRLGGLLPGLAPPVGNALGKELSFLL
ncbi:hypothetical protein Pyn_37635 [Prunus yedoensis var. nudiflora]|uniref:Uncharacterized protein n=1 Tax=Prunus yedoensis var. nudiflora TaxID=2094558 RepID=A0A314ZNK0_PRUYE|nr:hypothetical protein Pyn_37635 [Prunus yedoensis var. nudiflora]